MNDRIIIFCIIFMIIFSCTKKEKIIFSIEPKEKLTLKSTKSVTTNSQELVTIAGIINQSSKSYFFKLTGKKEEVQKAKVLFKKTIKTIQFKNGKVTWIIEKPWKEIANNSRIVAKKYSLDRTNLVFSITQLPHSSILSNVNRWRQQLSLNVIKLEELRSSLELIQLGNITVHYIEIIP